MAQHDYVIANGTGAAVRSDINNGLAAIVSNNSGASAPATTYAYMLWADTSTNLLKLRNGANSAWITVGDLTATNLGLAALASPTFTGTVTIPTATISTGVGIPLGSAASPTIYFTGDTNTGIYSPGADQFAITTGGSGRVFVDSSGRVGLGTSSPSATLHVATTGAGIQEMQWLRNGQSVAADVGSALVFTGTTSDNGLARISGAFAGAATTDGGYMALSTRAVTSGTMTERMRITAGGNVGIGTSSPGSVLDVRFGTNPANDNGGAANVLRVLTTVSSGADIGGAIALGGKATGTSDDAGFGQIAGRKTNATSGNYAGYLQCHQWKLRWIPSVLNSWQWGDNE